MGRIEDVKTYCFVCGSANTVKGKCLDCGYEFPFKFPCPLHNGSMSCLYNRKLCNKRFDYESCEVYQQHG